MSSEVKDSMSLDSKMIEGDVVLISNDGKDITLPKKDAYLSNLIKTTSQQDEKETKFNVNVSEHILVKVVEYLTHHKGIPATEIKKPLRSVDITKVVGDVWDANFINDLAQQDLLDIITAANYMDIHGLLQLACAKIAAIIKGKSKEDVRQLFADGKVGKLIAT
jgi:S-phase kinase-associated protein 1